MSIKDTLFRLLFRDKFMDLYHSKKNVEMLSDSLDNANVDYTRLENEVIYLKKQLERKSGMILKEPTMADLMLERLKVYNIDFSNTVKTGENPWLPPHYLYDETDEDTKKLLIAELNSIYSTSVWPKMIGYHINSQGNFTVRVADGEQQILAGRMTINGISLLDQDVRTGYNLYQESRKPEEEFDKFDLSNEV